MFSIPDASSGRVEKLRERISQLKEQRDALLVTYTSEWPAVKKLDAQIKGIEAELQKAPAEIVTAMQRRYEVAVSKEQLLRRSYEEQKGTTTQQTRDTIDLMALTHQLETNKQLLNTLLQRKRELDVANGNSGNEVSIATPSRLPKSPVGPPRLRNIIIAFLLSLAAALAWPSCSTSSTTPSSQSKTSIVTFTCPRWRDSSRWRSRAAVAGSAAWRPTACACKHDRAGDDHRCAFADC